MQVSWQMRPFIDHQWLASVVRRAQPKVVSVPDVFSACAVSAFDISSEIVRSWYGACWGMLAACMADDRDAKQEIACHSRDIALAFLRAADRVFWFWRHSDAEIDQRWKAATHAINDSCIRFARRFANMVWLRQRCDQSRRCSAYRVDSGRYLFRWTRKILRRSEA
jgi:hypothetical protein